VPIDHIAFGRPGRIYTPHEAPAVHEEFGRRDFMRCVFGVESDGKSRTEIMADAMTRCTRALGAHSDDRVLDE
jgi:hypothetical protein